MRKESFCLLSEVDLSHTTSQGCGKGSDTEGTGPREVADDIRKRHAGRLLNGMNHYGHSERGLLTFTSAPERPRHARWES